MNNELIMNWLNENKVYFEQKNLPKIFSNGKEIAILLKNIFKNKIDINNYIDANSFDNKLKN